MFRIALIGLFAFALSACSSGGHDHSSHDHGAAPSSTEAAAKPYPLATCVVSGEKLGSMGAPKRIVHQGQEVKFCCADCVKKFNSDPQKYMRAIAAAQSGR